MTLDTAKSMVTPPDEVKWLKGGNYFQPRPQSWFLEGTPGINSGRMPEKDIVKTAANKLVKMMRQAIADTGLKPVEAISKLESGGNTKWKALNSALKGVEAGHAERQLLRGGHIGDLGRGLEHFVDITAVPGHGVGVRKLPTGFVEAPIYRDYENSMFKGWQKAQNTEGAGGFAKAYSADPHTGVSNYELIPSKEIGGPADVQYGLNRLGKWGEHAAAGNFRQILDDIKTYWNWYRNVNSVSPQQGRFIDAMQKEVGPVADYKWHNRGMTPEGIKIFDMLGVPQYFKALGVTESNPMAFVPGQGFLGEAWKWAKQVPKLFTAEGRAELDRYVNQYMNARRQLIAGRWRSRAGTDKALSALRARKLENMSSGRITHTGAHGNEAIQGTPRR